MPQFKKALFLLLPLAMVLACWLGGCLESVSPLGQREHVSAASPLLGYWQEVSPNSSPSIYSVFYLGNPDYLLAVRSNRPLSYQELNDPGVAPILGEQYYLYVSHSQDQSFFSLKEKNDTDDVPYQLVKYEMPDANHLKIWEVRDEVASRALAEGTVTVQDPNEDRLTLTNSPEQLIRWITTLGPSDYKLYSQYERLPANQPLPRGD